MHPGAEVRLFINGQPRVCYPRVEAMGARELFRVFDRLDRILVAAARQRPHPSVNADGEVFFGGRWVPQRRAYEVLTIADNALSRAFQGLRRVVGFA